MGRLVPLDLVDSAGQEIRLRCSTAEFGTEAIVAEPPEKAGAAMAAGMGDMGGMM